MKCPFFIQRYVIFFSLVEIQSNNVKNTFVYKHTGQPLLLNEKIETLHLASTELCHLPGFYR